MPKRNNASFITVSSISSAWEEGEYDDDNDFAIKEETAVVENKKNQKMSKKRKKTKKNPPQQTTLSAPNNIIHAVSLTILPAQSVYGTLYYLLSTTPSQLPSMIIVPQPAAFVHLLKWCNVDAMPLHGKLSKKVLNENIKYLLSHPTMVCVTTAALSCHKALVDLSTIITTSTPTPALLLRHPTATIYHVAQENVGKSLQVHKAALLRAETRMKMATKLATLLTGTTSQNDAMETWVSKQCNGSELQVLPKTSSPLSAPVQATGKKLAVQLAFPLTLPTGFKVPPLNEMEEKWKLLHMVPLFKIRTSERCAAETCWLDNMAGEEVRGACWKGVSRRGACKDTISLALQKTMDVSTLQWAANPSPSEEWGGEYGKVLAHNEIVMHEVRPFVPMEVVNSRVCSKVYPAPGNRGYEGCLEYLQKMCRKHKRALTVWDIEAFHFITAKGLATKVVKRSLLHKTVSSLRMMMPNLRAWTVECSGEMHPRTLIDSILYDLFCLHHGRQFAQQLPPFVRHRIMTFLFVKTERYTTT